MAGHSKWANIKHRKAAVDAKRGKIFTKHAKLIAIAAREGGPDPDMNAALRTAITNAKADNTPNSNIEKAIKKGAGLDKDSADLEEIMYEGFGPEGTAFYVEVITDNRNRSVSEVKTIFNKNGGQMGEAGVVAWMFERRGFINADSQKLDANEAELMAIEAGAIDLERSDELFEIYTEDKDLMAAKDKLEELGFEVKKAELTFVPKNEIKIDNLEIAKKVLKLAEALDDSDEVTEVYSNFDIDDAVLEELNTGY